MISWLGALAWAIGVWLAFEWSRHLRRVWFPPTDEPPLVSGYLPFIGAAVSLGRGPPVDFLRQCRENAAKSSPNNPHGNFTLHVGGRNMTFVFDPAFFDAFFDSPFDENHNSAIDFRFATQPFLTRGFGVPRDLYFAHHERLLQTVRTVLTPQQLRDGFTEPLLARFQADLVGPWSSQCGGAGIMLYQSLYKSIFHASLSVLFGESLASATGLKEAFHVFDSMFELASSPMPHILLPNFTRAKQVLLRALTAMMRHYESADDNGDAAVPPLVQKMREGLGSKGLNHWLLALVWAAEANTVPTAFWTIVRLLEHPDYLARTVAQIDELVANRTNAATTPNNAELFTYDELQQLSLLNHAIQETIRLQAPPILLRGVRGDTVKVGDYKIPDGNYVCLSPYWSHRDESLFGATANDWDPSRFATKDYRNLSTIRFRNLSFGNGLYRCPGRYFAQFELSGLLALILRTFSLSFAPSQSAPDIDRNNLVGVTKPASDVRVVLRLRTKPTSDS